ncbi:MULTISPECIES: phosphate/phosphite/phosphonate ABC transporter substrate-binding protein [Caballeronia]|uniref:phosphate/phosphite/phosphonate ABC transporter substrate-binding protein n=1 Tax=Caballeronia TaxID=1827195 RepID=UPI00158DE62A|nr:MULTISPECIES: PhnD/SsuA/transferrin family substrate-binding protein [Caballeronia]MCG7402039.1 PhnD/SsuA/transferrin family substrate-binding protein [Caballeronia zhejiangensis]MCI1042556.1 PhnD/SsuA/transferrin family substrate-binding protein [Caballeronia zhejiangensis]
MHWIAALPMYNVAPALAADWRTLLERVREQLADWLRARGDTLEIVDPGADLTAFWLRDDVLLSQTCGYPLVHALANRVQVVGAPDFNAPGCETGAYRSVIVVGARVGAQSVEDCRNLRAAYNDDDSNSGMNLFRHAVAPYAHDGRFFASVTKTGAHLASLAAIAEARADIAAIDCVTFAFAQAHLPELTAGGRVLDVTAGASALPFIASLRVPPDSIDAILDALADALADDPALAARLRLKGIVRRTQTDYAAILDYEREAIERGYPRLA